MGDQDFLSRKVTKVFHDVLFCLKSICSKTVCNPQRKKILKSVCQRYNNLKLTCIFNGPILTGPPNVPSWVIRWTTHDFNLFYTLVFCCSNPTILTLAMLNLFLGNMKICLQFLYHLLTLRCILSSVIRY